MKVGLTGIAASAMLKLPFLENGFRYFCSQERLRKRLHLGALAYGCVHCLNAPEIRMAVLDNYKMYVNIAEPIGIQSYFFHINPFAWLASTLISSGDVCIDVGANMGHYTFLMASIVGSSGKVISFEPQPYYFSLIQDSIKLNDLHNTIVENKALWDESGKKLNFYLSENPNNSGTSSLINHGLYLNEKRSLEVETITIFDYIEDHNIEKINLIKIDVERAEFQVLQGMRTLLLKNSVDFLIVETCAHGLSHELLKQLGYRCFYIDERNKNIIDTQKIDEGFFGDYLFVSPQKSLHSLANFVN
ncbi:MAG: FkbM family methyltransferase [Leptolyngbyaceae cyanobacterium MO_188.B28]|nr:FkbM family methyltransferase [Leptolyngbyaceae cyanobacterium MO_188.B28]